MADDRTYIRVHDGLDEHPKVEPLSDAAFRLLMTCWFYCSRNRTNGRIGEAVWRKRGTPKARRELLDAGLVEQHTGHVEMHDYLEHQRSAEEIKLLQEVRGDASERGNHIRWHVVRRQPKKSCELCYPPDEKTPGLIAKAIANGIANPIPNGSQTDPKPVPSTEAEAEASTDASIGYERRGGYVPNARDTPPRLFPDHCQQHADEPVPGKCGDCADQRKANALRPRHLAAVSSPMKRCIVHDQSYTHLCSGCESDRKAAS